MSIILLICRKLILKTLDSIEESDIINLSIIQLRKMVYNSVGKEEGGS